MSTHTSGLSRIGVVGIGTMGSGIAQVAATSGFDTVVVDLNADALARGTGTINASLERLVVSYEKSGGERGLPRDERDAAAARLKISGELSDLLGCDIVIEAIVEKYEVKAALYQQLAQLGYDRILVSNTSSISITRLAQAYGKPELFMLASSAAITALTHELVY